MDGSFGSFGGFSFGETDTAEDKVTKDIAKKADQKAPNSPGDFNIDDFNFANFADDDLAPTQKPVAQPQSPKSLSSFQMGQEKDPFAGQSNIFDFDFDDTAEKKPEPNLKVKNLSSKQDQRQKEDEEDGMAWGDFYGSIEQAEHVAGKKPEAELGQAIKATASPPTTLNQETAFKEKSWSPQKPVQNAEPAFPQEDDLGDDFGDDFGGNPGLHKSSPPAATETQAAPSEVHAITPNPGQRQLIVSPNAQSREPAVTFNAVESPQRTYPDTVAATWLKSAHRDEPAIGKTTRSQFVKVRQPSTTSGDDTSDEAGAPLKRANPFDATQRPIYYSPPKSEVTTDDTSLSTADNANAAKPVQPATEYKAAVQPAPSARLPPRSHSTSPVVPDNMKKLHDQLNIILSELRNLTASSPDVSQLASAVKSEIARHFPNQQTEQQTPKLKPADVQSIVQSIMYEVRGMMASNQDSSSAVNDVQDNMRRLEENILDKLQRKTAEDSAKEHRLMEMIRRLEMQLGGVHSEVSSLALKSDHYRQAHSTDPNVLALNAALNIAEERAKRAEDKYSESIQKVSDLTASAKRAMEEAERIKIEANTALNSTNFREAKARDLEEELNRHMEALHTRERNVIARESEIRKKEAALRERTVQLETELLKLTTQKAELEELKAKVEASRQLSAIERSKLITEQEAIINNTVFPVPAQVPTYPPIAQPSYVPIAVSSKHGYDALPSSSATGIEPPKRSKSAAREDLERAVTKADKALRTSQSFSNRHAMKPFKKDGFLVDTAARSSLAAMEYDIAHNDPKREALRVARQYLQERALARSMVNTSMTSSKGLSGSIPLTHSLSLQNSSGPMHLTAVPTHVPRIPQPVGNSSTDGYGSLACSLPSSRTSYVEPQLLPTVATVVNPQQALYSTQHHSVPYSSRPTSRTSDNVTAQVTAINRPFTPIEFDQSHYTPADVIYRASLTTVTPMTEVPKSIARRTAAKGNSFDISSESVLAPLTSDTSKSVDAPVITAVSQVLQRQPSANTTSNSASAEIAMTYEPKPTASAAIRDENLDIRGSASVMTAVQNPPSLSTSSTGPEVAISQATIGPTALADPDNPGLSGLAPGSIVQNQPAPAEPVQEPSMSASAPIPFPANRENPMFAVQSSKSDPSTSGSISAVSAAKRPADRDAVTGASEPISTYFQQGQSDLYASAPFTMNSQPGLLDALSESNNSHYTTSRFTGRNEFYDFSPHVVGNPGYSLQNPFEDIKYDLGLSNFNSNEHSTSPMFPF